MRLDIIKKKENKTSKSVNNSLAKGIKIFQRKGKKQQYAGERQQNLSEEK